MRDYRSWLKEIVEASALSFSKLATATRIQRTFLSQVVNHRHHLSNDQLFSICEALDLPDAQREHLFLLSEWERCRFPVRKAHLEKKLEGLEKKEKGSDRSLIPPALDQYFCEPWGEIVLRFLSIDAYRLAPEKIRQRIGLSTSRWDEILLILENAGFIARQGEAISVLKGAVYPKEHSAAERIRNIQARVKVSEQKMKQRDIDEFLYNWWFISNPERKQELKIAYLHLLGEIYQESLQVPREQVYQLSIDLFQP